MKINLKLLLIGIVLLSIGSFIMLMREYYSLQEKYEVSQSNVKAYTFSLDSTNKTNRELKLSVEQFNTFRDSILTKLKEEQKRLNIKDKELKYLTYLNSEASKTDTLIYRDTIFRDNLVRDTVISDKWYSLSIKLRYPDSIIVSPTFISEKYIITNYRKETINPPKKCWLLRLFQKKHKVVEVNVVEKNPYIKENNNRFIDIVK